jgi:membrane protein DedA with SNARE-associated domain
VTHLVDTYGYPLVAAFVALEALGIPFPGETVLVAAGAYAGATHHLSVWALWAVAVGSVLAGSTAGFALGEWGGYRLLRRYGAYIRMREKEIKIGRYVFDRYGPVVVCLGRYVAVLRTYAPFLAGTNRMNRTRFALFNLIGALAWTGTWTWLSYELGARLERASTTVDYGVAAAAVVAVVVAVMVGRRRVRQLELAAEAAYPGPLPD